MCREKNRVYERFGDTYMISHAKMNGVFMDRVLESGSKVEDLIYLKFEKCA